MSTEDLSLVIFYILSAVVMVTCGILCIREERKMDCPDYTSGIMYIIGGLTPGSMIVFGFVLSVAFIFLIAEGPNWLLKKFLNKKL